jgi:lipopolysaccharide cholinephosphotransferase
MQHYNKYLLVFLISTVNICPMFANKFSKKIIANRPLLTDKRTVLQLYQLMKDVHEILECNNITYWVIAGTCLGAVRHHGLIPWDDDLDISINQQQADKFFALKPIFEALGYEIAEWGSNFKIWYKNGKKLQFNLLQTNGTTITMRFPFLDIFLYKQEGNNIYYKNFDSNLREEQGVFKGIFIDANDLFPLKDYKFGEISVKGPNNPFNYLYSCYGSDCLNVAYFYGNHKDTNPNNRKKMTLTLQKKDFEPAQPTGPLLNRVQSMRSHQEYTLETIELTSESLQKFPQIFDLLKPIFIESFAEKTGSLIKEEHPEEYATLQQYRHSIKDILASRYTNIVNVMVSQLNTVNKTFITLLKNDLGAIAGYAFFIQNPINQIIQSMINRNYIKSIISLPKELLTSENSYNDAYLLSVCVAPMFQKQGLGKKLIHSILTECPQAKNIYLLTAESKTNLAIQQLYEHLQFKPIGILETSDNNKKILYCLNTDRIECDNKSVNFDDLWDVFFE